MSDINMLSVRAVAERLAVSKSTVYELLGAGEITHYKVGGRIVVDAADLERYLEGCRVASKAEELAALGAPVSLQQRRERRTA